MSKLINEYLKQEHIKEQKQREYEHEYRTASLLDFADQMDEGKIVQHSDVIYKLMKNGHATDISGFHDIAVTRNTHYLYDKTHDLLALADETDLKKNRVYNLIAKIQTYISYLTFVYVIAVLYVGLTGILDDQRDLIAAIIIFVAASFINSLLFIINSEYHQKYELYGVREKDKSTNSKKVTQ